MEMSTKWNICRICLQEDLKTENRFCGSVQLLYIFDAGKKLSQLIYEFSGVIVKPNDFLPDKICNECLRRINIAVQFKKTCRASNTYLQSLLQRTNVTSSLLEKGLPSCEVRADKSKEKIVKEEIYYSKVAKYKDIKSQFSNKPSSTIDTYIKHNNLSQQKVVIAKEQKRLQKQSKGIPKKIASQTEKNSSDEAHFASNEDKPNFIHSTTSFYKYNVNASLRNTQGEHYEHTGHDRDLAENEENKSCDLKMCYILKNIKNENSSSTDNEDVERHAKIMHQIAGETLEQVKKEEAVSKYLQKDIKDDLMLYMEKGLHNQPELSSAAYKCYKIENGEQNSETSSILSESSEEYIVDNTLDKYNNLGIERNIKETFANRFNLGSAPAAGEGYLIERKTPIIFSRRKIKPNHAQSDTKSVALGLACEICSKKFSTRKQVKVHMQVYHHERNYQCGICSNRFINGRTLRVHMRIHTGEKPFECKYCGRRCNDRSSNLRHERTHTKERPFKCSDCCKTFSLAKTLQNHMKVHTNERLYRCEPCGKSFKLLHHLKTHENTSLHRSVLELVV